MRKYFHCYNKTLSHTVNIYSKSINLKTGNVRNFNKYYKEVKLSLQYNNMVKLCMKNIYLLLNLTASVLYEEQHFFSLI